MALSFKIITPDQVVLDSPVEYVYLPGSLGEMGILDHHAALITALEPGVLRYKIPDEEERSMVVGNGYVQVDQDEILMVTDLALNSAQIDESSVEKAIEQAKEALKAREAMTREEEAKFEADLAKQMMVLNFKRKRPYQS